MKTHLDVLKERRKLLQNPYAFADELDALQAVRRDRLRLGNPYAHVEELAKEARPIARFDGISERKGGVPIAPRKRRSDAELEEFVRQVQLRLWAKRGQLFGTEEIDPIQILDPGVALRSEDYEIEELDTLGRHASKDGAFEVAGLIDRQQRLVQFSRQFSRPVQKFTLAHELGHALLHDAISMHRDRPLDGTTQVLDIDEREANRFATLFLMPEKQVRRTFEEQFGASPVRFDERASFGGKVPRGVELNRAAARMLSTTTRHNGIGFPSLADRFGVSVEAMAIRLEELNLFVLSNNLSKRGRQ